MPLPFNLSDQTNPTEEARALARMKLESAALAVGRGDCGAEADLVAAAFGFRDACDAASSRPKRTPAAESSRYEVERDGHSALVRRDRVIICACGDESSVAFAVLRDVLGDEERAASLARSFAPGCWPGCGMRPIGTADEIRRWADRQEMRS